MLKKLTLLALSVGALLAFAAPAQAANPLLTNDLGEPAPTYITATSSNTITHTSAGTLECTTVELTLHITENTNNKASGHGTGKAEGTVPAKTHTGHCGSSSGAVVEITNVTVSNISLEKVGAETKGTAGFSFTYDLRSATGAGLLAECTFGTTAENKVEVTKTGTHTIKIHGNIVKTAGGAFCPSGGSITGDFTLEEDVPVSPRPIHIH